MSWISILKFLAPVSLFIGWGMYQHDAGWKKRDATVAQEKQDAATAAAQAVNDQCAKDKALTSGVSHEYQIKLKAANDRLSAALGSLYDARHGDDKSSGISGSAGGRDGLSSAYGLYYADERAAVAALDRAAIATRQAEQLIACQGFIRGERAP